MKKTLDVLSVDCDWVNSKKQLTDLISFVAPLLVTHEEIHLAYDHHDIYQLFPLNCAEEINIYNIDHHHDYAYKIHATLEESNWMFHLTNMFPTRINYLWVCNPESEHMGFDNYQRFKQKIKTFKFDFNLNSIEKRRFDKIFVCSSPGYNTSQEAIMAYKIIEGIIKNESRSKRWN